MSTNIIGSFSFTDSVNLPEGKTFNINGSPHTHAGGGTIGGSTGSTDNAILRADGTGGSTAQGSTAQLYDDGQLYISKCYITSPSSSAAATELNHLGTGDVSVIYFAEDTAYKGSILHYGSEYASDTTRRLQLEIKNDVGSIILTPQSGKVGILTATPGSYYSTASNLVIYGAASSGMTIASGSSSVGQIFFADGTDSVNKKIEGQIVYDHATNSMSFYTNHANLVMINGAGNVGAGMDAGDITKLCVKGIGATSSSYSLVCRNSSETATMRVDDAGVISIPALAGGGKRAIYVDNNGNICV